MRQFIRYIVILLIVSIAFVLPAVAASPVSLSQPIHHVESSDTINWSLSLRDMLDYDPMEKSIFPEFHIRFRGFR